MTSWILIWIRSLGAPRVWGGEEASLEEEIAEQMGIAAGTVVWKEAGEETLGSLSWSGDRIGQTAYTFLSELDLTGTATPGAVIYYGILTKEEDEWVLWEKNSARAGASGLVQEKISLPKIGWQYVAVFVSGGDLVYGCVYPVERMSRELEESLWNLRMNLYAACAAGEAS